MTTPWVYQSLSSRTGPLTVIPTPGTRVIEESMREGSRRGKGSGEGYCKKKLQETLS